MPRRTLAETSSDSPEANLESIAKRLGVAISTVSRALRNHPGIHPTTRLKVQTEAARMGYAMKRRAQDAGVGEARTGSTGEPVMRHVLTLALTMSHRSQQGYLTGISRAAQAHDFGVFSHHCAADQAEGLLNAGSQPAALRVPDLAGIILIHRWPNEVVAQLARRHPVVSLIHRYPGLPVDVVGMDDEANLAALVAHLRAQGHEKIGFFGYNEGFSWARTRFAAYVGAMVSAGLKYDPANVIAADDGSASAYDAPDCGWAVAPVKARMKAGVKAWIGSSYVLAQGLARTLRGAGLKVPGDVSLTGYHGSIRVGEPMMLHPTTIELDDEAIGGAAVHLLQHRILRAVPAPCVLLLPGMLQQGETTLAS